MAGSVCVLRVFVGTVALGLYELLFFGYGAEIKDRCSMIVKRAKSEVRRKRKKGEKTCRL